MNRLQKLSDVSFLKVACRVLQTIENLMGGPHMGYQPFGWDWPTTHVLYPRKYSLWQSVKAEANRRGITACPMERYKRRNGKIIVKYTERKAA
jgi:hypothetical protein